MELGKIKYDLRGIASELMGRLLAVPIYQRSYAWSRQQTGDFWDDLRAARAQGSDGYFLGTIVLTSQGLPPRDTIIDGQQRLATTAILLAAIRDEFLQRFDEIRGKSVESDYLAKTDLRTAQTVSRIQLNSDDSHFFELRIICRDEMPAPSRPSHELILATYEFFRTQITKVADDAGPDWFKRLSEWVEFLKTSVQVIVLEVPTEADAFLIFETLNDRGADLTIADLLKNYLFGHAGSRLDVVRDGWMRVLGALEIPAETSLFTTFLRHYWSSMHGAVRERDLYKSIKDHVVNETQVLEFIAQLEAAAAIYSALLSSSSDYWDPLGGSSRENVETLLRLDLEQNRPLLLAALQHFPNTEGRSLLKRLVAWSVRGLIVGGIGGGTTEKAYCQAAVGIRRGTIKTAEEVFASLAEITPTDSEFENAFRIARVPKGPLARYYLRALERAAVGEPEPEFVPNANEEEVNLEHVLPKNAKANEWPEFSTDERRDVLHRIGNLALLQKGPNGRIGNKPFATKKLVLAGSRFTLTSDVALQSDWTPTTIDERQKKLAALATKVWPR